MRCEPVHVQMERPDGKTRLTDEQMERPDRETTEIKRRLTRGGIWGYGAWCMQREIWNMKHIGLGMRSMECGPCSSLCRVWPHRALRRGEMRLQTPPPEPTARIPSMVSGTWEAEATSSSTWESLRPSPRLLLLHHHHHDDLSLVRTKVLHPH